MTKQKVLVMEDEPGIGDSLKKMFDYNGLDATLITTPNDGLKILEGQQFDFVVSDGEGWQSCYNRAIDLYSMKKVVIYSGNRELVGQLKRQGYLVYIKGSQNNDTIKSPGGLVDEVKRLLSIPN